VRLQRTAFHAMGSPCELQLYGDDEVQAVADAAVAEVRRLEQKYSRYTDDSVTTRINRAAGKPEWTLVDAETAGLLDYAETAWHHSGGLFDLTSGVLRRAWDFSSGRVPGRDEIRPLLKQVGWGAVEWSRPRIRLSRVGMEIDFGGCVKEYTVDRVAELCRQRGLRHGLVNLGGDMGVVGPHPDGSPWRVGIAHPREPQAAIAWVALERGAIASSGDYERFMLVDGKRYCHILNPKTGSPARGLAAASVLAPQCLIAGTASTVALIEGRERGPEWLRELGLPHIWVDEELRLGGTLADAREWREVGDGPSLPL
jgi:thiamine biosynthesis lipoprotein